MIQIFDSRSYGRQKYAVFDRRCFSCGCKARAFYDLSHSERTSIYCQKTWTAFLNLRSWISNFWQTLFRTIAEFHRPATTSRRRPKSAEKLWQQEQILGIQTPNIAAADFLSRTPDEFNCSMVLYRRTVCPHTRLCNVSQGKRARKPTARGVDKDPPLNAKLTYTKTDSSILFACRIPPSHTKIVWLGCSLNADFCKKTNSPFFVHFPFKKFIVERSYFKELLPVLALPARGLLEISFECFLDPGGWLLAAEGWLKNRERSLGKIEIENLEVMPPSRMAITFGGWTRSASANFDHYVP